ncbi:hypothetical protein AB0K00_45195 [Dactylosporangium sp. NPDC049525]|uniref:hypothetical protein n=1 Tax=Dactylosporangium sp. NPDC049525 TaxID=3154730 RepID=UPI003444C582
MTDDIAETIRRAADTVPPSRSDLAAVLRRHRAHRRRRAALATVAAAVAVTVVTGATVALNQRLAGTAPAQVPATAQQSAPQTQAPTQPSTQPSTQQEQRLPLDAGWALGAGKDGTRVTVPDVRALLELRAGERIVTTAVPAAVVDDIRAWLPIDNKRSVVLGGKNLKPGVQRDDGPDVTDYSVRLLVLMPDGQITQQREVRVQGQDVQLIGATATTAYLYRTPGRIMAHDLATGAEQRLTTLDPVPGWDANTLSVQGGILFAVSQESCQLTATALDTGRKTTTDLRPWSCPTMRAARLSPDGRTLAVAVNDGAGDATVRLLKVDVATGKVTASPVSGGVVAGNLRPGPLGVAWIGTTVRVAWVRMPAPGVHTLSESTQVTDVPAN